MLSSGGGMVSLRGPLRNRTCAVEGAKPSSRDVGKPGFPTPLTRWEGHVLIGGPALLHSDDYTIGLIPSSGKAGGPVPLPKMGEPGSPIPPPAGGPRPPAGGMGKPGFPIPPPGGRVWADAARPQGGGETGFPHPPTRWEGLGGRSPCAGGWGNRVSPPPCP